MATRRTPSNGPRRGSRPANSRPGARGTERARPVATGAPRPRFTNRMAVLVVVAAVLVVSYASSMRAYLEQRSLISDLRSQISASTSDISSLQREKRRWADKAYVEAQARERFGWVMPGETSYHVIGKDGKPLGHGDQLSDPTSVARQVPEAWWDKAYSSLESADHPKRAPTPATRIQAPAPSPTASPTPSP
jgi:cell division protein FtsB